MALFGVESPLGSLVGRNAWASPDQAGNMLILEEEYASIMGRVLSDVADAMEAVENMETVCRRRAQQLRNEMVQVVHRPMRYMHLQNLAQELEAQAATWHLVWNLYCNAQPASGTGGPEVLGAGGRVISRQMLADRIRLNPTLNRCASVVAWLESLADDALGQEGPRFAKHEGVWLETQQKLGQAGTVSELDPDAPGRQGAGLHADNQAAEQRLLARCWQLVRAGRYSEARALCRACGQPWRAASLGGHTGDWGPLPVGTAAGRLEEDMELNPDTMAEEMATEIEMGGPAAPRALWKWTCLQVALQASSKPTPGSQYEAALYGVLASHLPSILPMCTTWRDHCWAYCRTWLDQAADQGLAEEQGGARSPTIMAGEDVVVDVIVHFATSQSKGRAAAQGALGAAAGDFTVLGRWDASGGAVKGSFEGMFEALKGSGLPTVVSEATEPLCKVQQLLIQNDMPGLAQHMYDWLVAGGAGGGDDMMLVAGGVGQGHDEEEPMGLPPRSARMVAFGCHLLLALEALGVLYAQGAVLSAEDALTNTRVSGLSEQVVGLYAAGLMERSRHDLVPQYMCHVNQGMRDLLSNELLTALTSQLLEAHETGTAPAPSRTAPGDDVGNGAGTGPTPASPADRQALGVYCAMERWFSHCWQRQEGLARVGAWVHGGGEEAEDEAMGEAGVRSYLRTNIRNDETRRLLNTYVSAVRWSTRCSPDSVDAGTARTSADTAVGGIGSAVATGGAGLSALGRVTALRWLWYPYLAMQQQRTAPDVPGALLRGGPMVWLDGLDALISLAEELSLGDAHALAAGVHMMDRVMPPGFTESAEAQSDMLLHQAGVFRAQAAAAMEAQDAEVAMTSCAQAEKYHEELTTLLKELRGWRLYFTKTRHEASWRRTAYGGGAGAGWLVPGGEAARTAMLAEGKELLTSVMGQLLSPLWMSGLPTPSKQPAAATTVVQLVVTAAFADSATTSTDQAALEEACVAADAPVLHPYPTLKGAALADVEQHLRQCLEAGADRLMSAIRGGETDRDLLDISVTSPSEKEGHITVTLTGATEQEPMVSQVLLALSCGMVQGSVLGLSQALQVVNLDAPPTYAQAICQRCCIAKAALMCARLRYNLSVLDTKLTLDSAHQDEEGDGEDLATLLVTSDRDTDVVEGGKLFGALSGVQLAEVLRLEAETVVQRLAHAQAARNRGR